MDDKLKKAIELVVVNGASTQMLCRTMELPFNEVVPLMDKLEDIGVIGPFKGNKPREVLMNENQIKQLIETI